MELFFLQVMKYGAGCLVVSLFRPVQRTGICISHYLTMGAVDVADQVQCMISRTIRGTYETSFRRQGAQPNTDISR